MNLDTLREVGPSRLRSRQARTTGPPAPSPGSLAFDWTMTLRSAVPRGGIVLDGWAHTHGRLHDACFAPWHCPPGATPRRPETGARSHRLPMVFSLACR